MDIAGEKINNQITCFLNVVRCELFRGYILDHNEFNATVLIGLIKKVIAGILGKELPEDTDAVEQDAESAKN